MPHAAESAFLKELFDEEAQTTSILHTSTQTQAVVLSEKSRGAKLKKITITHLGETPFALLPEKGQGSDRRYSPLLAKPAGYSHHQACDAVLFFERNGKFYEVCIELKSDSPRGCEKQFQATCDFIDYTKKVLASQKHHMCVKRERRKVVLNTKVDNSLKSKQKTHPNRFQHNEIVYVKVSDGETIATNCFFC